MHGIRISASTMLLAGLLAGSATGVAAQDEPPDPMAPALVTGTIAWASSCDPATTTAEDGLIQERGHHCAPRTVTSDDPRLGGTSSLTWNKDVHVFDGPRLGIRTTVEEIQGVGGGWVCRAVVLDGSSGFFATSIQGSELTTCTGNGTNQGLTALLVLTTGNGQEAFEGLIFPGELPPGPVLAAE